MSKDAQAEWRIHMINLGRKWKLFTAAILGLSLAQCSKESLEKDFNVYLINKNPLVRVIKRTFGEVEISPNWFDLGFYVQNNTPYNVKIEEVLFYVDVDEEVGPLSFDLGNLSVTTDDGETYDYINYCMYPSGMTAAVRFKTCRKDLQDATNVPSPPSGQPPLALDMIFYIGDIPKYAHNPDNLAYNVRMEIYGIFVDSMGVELKRFQKNVYFSTQ